MRRLLIVFLVLTTGGGVVLGAGTAWIYNGFHATGPLENDSTLIIARGAGTGMIAENLASASVISNPTMFKAGVRLFADAGSMKAGEYLFPAGVSAANAVRILQGGKTVMRKVTVPEGLSVFAAMHVLNRAEGLRGAVMPYPEEGVLLPETYNYSFGDTRQDIVNRMMNSQQRLLADLWPKRADGLPLNSPREAVILASIVEKETGKAGERARVAAVFINRLKKKMRLQSDPTVVYGLTLGEAPLGRSLTRKDLKSETPYNTYVIRGLPPGPIANPGREAIAAVLHPAESKDLYFVADGTGGHAFARTLKQHNRNVARWRKIQKQRKNGG